MNEIICRVANPKEKKDIKPTLQDKTMLFLLKRLCKCQCKVKCYLPSPQMISKQLHHQRIAKMKSWAVSHKQCNVPYKEFQCDLQ